MQDILSGEHGKGWVRMSNKNIVKLEVFVQYLNDFVRWVSCVLLLEAVDIFLNEHPDLAPQVATYRWDFKTAEGLQRITELGITVFPTVTLDGIITFQGRIPDETELLESISSRIWS